MSPAFTIIVDALRDKPEGWETIVADNFKCTLPYEWPLLEILAKGFTPSGGDGTGDVTAASNFGNDNRITRSNGTLKGIQSSTWTLLDTGEASATITGEDGIGLALVSTGVNGIAISGTNTTNVGVGVQGATAVSGGVGVSAVTSHASGIPLQIIINGGHAANISFLGTNNRNINFPDLAGTVVLADAGSGVITSSGLTINSGTLKIGTALAYAIFDPSNIASTDKTYLLPNDNGTLATQEWATANITANVDQAANYTWTGDHDFSGGTVILPTIPTLDATTVNVSIIRPATDDGAPLGDITHRFSDLFLASGAVINFASGNVAMTHGSGLLTVTAGELRITTPGTNAASVPTNGSTSTFTGKSIGAGALTFLESAYILLDSVLSADGVFTGTAIPGTAGATLAFGDAIYLDPTDSRWELTDANAAAGADGDCRGLVGVCILAAAADGDPTRILVHGTVRADTAFPSFTVGAPVYFSETAGDLTNTAPVTTDSVARIIGWAVDANSILVSPSGLWDTHA
jgi:hypothetical protein